MMWPTTKAKMKLLLMTNVVVAMGAVVYSSLHFPEHDWLHFGVYLVTVLVASGLRVKMPGGDSTISINFPFILLSIIEASPIEALLLAAISVLFQCTRQKTQFTVEQIVFNVSNSICATAAAWSVYQLTLTATKQILPAVATATLAYAAVNALLVARMIAWAADMKMLDVLEKGFVDCVPYYLFASSMAGAVALISAKYGWLSGQLILPVAWTCYRTVGLYVGRGEERRKHFEELTSLHMRTIESLAMAIEAKDRNTHDHLCRVKVYAAGIGAEMHLSKEEMQALLAASVLHDIGKLAVPEHIVTKPGKLTVEEFEKMKIHPIVGAEILERVGFPYPVVPIVRSHHERWDGKGYPDGLAGADIPVGARILAAVDCFDALASDRPYRPALPLDQVIEYIKKLAGSQFDAAVVEILERKYTDLEFAAAAESAKMTKVRASVIIKGGDAHAAGFEKSESKNNPLSLPDRRSGDRRGNDAASSHGPLDSIAAAGHEAQVLYQLSQTLGNSLSMEETLFAMEEQLKLLISYDCFALYLVDGDNLVPVHASGVDKKLFKNLVVPVGDGVSGWVTESRLPIINGNPSVEFGFLNPKVETSLLSAIAIPLEKAHGGKDGHVFGVLALFSTQQDAFSHDHLRLLQAIIEKGARSIENSLTYRRVESEANTDHLTGLLNSRGFMLKAEEKIENCATSLALIACDLDDFKLVNDTGGHPTGDELLRAVAEVFVGVCGQDAAVARLGGDEFAAILVGLDERKVDDLLGQIVLAIEEVSTQILPDLQISASLGAAFLGEDGTTLGQLASLADRRMYAMKRADSANGRILQMAKAAS